MPNKIFKATLVLLSLILFAAPSIAQQQAGIVAVVNDDVITAFDLESRLRLVLSTSGMRNNAETRQRIGEQVLRSLVDERLKLQEAKRLAVEISDQAITTAIDRIAQQSGSSAENLISRVVRAGATRDTLFAQVRANLAWLQVLRQVGGARIQVTPEEIADAVALARGDGTGKSYRVSEIFLAVETNKRDAEVKQIAERLFREVRGGGNFASVAQQFSQSTSAANGGDMGWVSPTDMEPEVGAAIQEMRPGQIRGPIRSQGGYHILALVDVNDNAAASSQSKNAKVSIHQVLVPFTEGMAEGQKEDVAERARSISQGVIGCAALDSASNNLEGAISAGVNDVPLSSLNPGVQQAATTLPLNRPSPPIVTPGGVIVLMVCERDNIAQTADVLERRIENQLVNERVELFSRHHLQDLRRTAFIELRL
ncbi:MAG: peptidylprolyl isomerase [Magnetospiraceae bacterium]